MRGALPPQSDADAAGGGTAARANTPPAVLVRLVTERLVLREFVGGFVARRRDEPRRVFQLAITLPAEDSRLIGNCGVRVNDPEQREGNTGYELDPAYWGHGYATEAARAMLTLSRRPRWHVMLSSIEGLQHAQGTLGGTVTGTRGSGSRSRRPTAPGTLHRDAALAISHTAPADQRCGPAASPSAAPG